MGYNCIICEADIGVAYYEDGSVEPASRYWLGANKNNAFCSVECSFEEHQKIYEQKRK